MTAIINVSAVDRPVIIITRDFDAPRELVWKVITDPKHVAAWYGGPGFTNPVCEIDLRPGGAWRQVMQAPNGARYTINSVFEEIVELERLAWRTIKDPDRNPAPPTSFNTVTLARLSQLGLLRASEARKTGGLNRKVSTTSGG
jgi:uncharacterized protein YndB with AHSA1/START domain